MRARRVQHRVFMPVTVAAMALALSISGCGSGGSSRGTSAQTTPQSGGSTPSIQTTQPAAASATTSTTTTTSESATTAAGPSADLVAAAKKEGKVVVYTTFSASDLKGMIDAFNKDYPDVQVQTLRLTGAQVPARIEAEQKGGAYVADVVTADAPEIMALVQAKALTPYDPPEQTKLPAGLTLPDGYTGVAYLLTAAIAYNPSLVKSAHLSPPTSWEDLTKPEWKGKFSVDPTALDWYEMLIASMGHDKALQLLKDLGNNSPVFVESHTQALTQVQSGQQLAAATAYGYKAASLEKKTPTQMAFVNPNPLPAALNLVDIAKNPPHPNAARLFEDWLVSQHGQAAIVKVTNHTSLRDDVGNDLTVFDPQKWTPVFANSNISNDQYNAYMNELKQALHAQ